MKFLSEQTNKLEILTESADEGKEPEYYIEGVFLQSEIKNRNGRIYPRDVMARAVEVYKHDYVDKMRAYGEWEHPQNLSINLDRISHLITDIYQDPNDNRLWRAKAKLLDTPCGRIAKAILKEGGHLGVSSRAGGSVVRKNGADIVQNDFRLVTAGDLVFLSSAQTAENVSLLVESTQDWEWDETNNEFVPKKGLTEQQKTELQVMSFEKLLNSLTK